MPKNSRPDIQVLEDRIVRLKAQLLEYKDLRLYSVTKRRLSVVSDGLEECIGIIDEIVSSGSNNITSSSMSAFTECPIEGPSEFSGDGDLLDIFLLNPPEGSDTKVVTSRYSPKKIVSTFSKRIQKLAESEEGTSSGILQVNQFCQLLNSWYQTRYTPDVRNPEFKFKSDRIHEWVDLLMLAAGQAMHRGLFPAFLSDMNTWIESIPRDRENIWSLPYSVMQMNNIDASCCTQEAVLLEIMIKPSLYDKSFYPDERTSIHEIVITNSKFTEDDLKIDKIIQDCPKLIVTSSFDASKYREEANV